MRKFAVASRPVPSEAPGTRGTRSVAPWTNRREERHKMRKLVLAAVAVVALAVPAASRAQFQLGARVGYAWASGDAFQGTSLADAISTQVPIQVDVGFKVMPGLTLGAYGSYGFGQKGSLIKSLCTGASSCSDPTDIRFGVQALFALPLPILAPWVGIGTGYEQTHFKASGVPLLGGQGLSATFSGWEYFNLQAGADVLSIPTFGLGPYVQYSLGQYSSLSGVRDLIGTPGKTNHSWFTIGVRGNFSI